ncbi:hypothetical protein [Altererythrobacter lauratis]|uniref:Uncharacterized protein n=1 Tax=Alteraurantiacibacter lauratis TaxID=2054627 RepID=A0ABV7EFR0_9SPHN
MFKSILASTAAAGLLLAPIAAQANTRAADASVSLAPLAEMTRQSSPIGAARNAVGDIDEALLVVLFGAIGTAIIVIIENQEDDASAGA